MSTNTFPKAEGLQDQLYYGVKSIFQKWTALQLAVEGEWGGHDTLAKVEWFNETLANYLYDQGKKIDVSDIEQVLEQIMSDEFMIILEDNSQTQIAEYLFRLYKELSTGVTRFYEELILSYNKAKSDESRTVQQSTLKSSTVKESNPILSVTTDSGTEDEMI